MLKVQRSKSLLRFIQCNCNPLKKKNLNADHIIPTSQHRLHHSKMSSQGITGPKQNQKPAWKSPNCISMSDVKALFRSPTFFLLCSLQHNSFSLGGFSWAGTPQLWHLKDLGVSKVTSVLQFLVPMSWIHTWSSAVLQRDKVTSSALLSVSL